MENKMHNSVIDASGGYPIYIYAQLSFDQAEDQWLVEAIEGFEELEDANEIAALNYCGTNGYRVIKIEEDPQGYNVYWLEKELKP